MLIVELHFLNASENNVMPSLTSTSTVNNNTRHEVCPITVLLTSASDIKSWTARRPTVSAPHSHALNRPHEDQPSPVWPPPVRSPLPAASSSNPSRTPARGARAGAPYENSVHRVFSSCRLHTRMSALACVATISHLLRGALHLPEGHPRQQRVHRQSDARCDPCVVSGKAMTHTLSVT